MNNSAMMMTSTLKNYLSLIRFSHTIFALPFAILSSVWAWLICYRTGVHTFRWVDGLGVLLCMVCARSFAMAFNRLVDAKFDAMNPRTASRHLPAGVMSSAEVRIFMILCALAFVASCTLFLPNRLPLMFAIPLLIFLAGYSIAKRWTAFVHFWLGAALALAPICAWIALRGQAVIETPIDILPACSIGTSVFFWVAGFDIIYACQDAEVDRKLGLHSLPARLGIANSLSVAAACHAIMVIPLVLLPFLCPLLGLGWKYALGLMIVIGVLFFEHRSVSAKNLDQVNVAFFNANAVISVVLMLAGIYDAVT